MRRAGLFALLLLFGPQLQASENPPAVQSPAAGDARSLPMGKGLPVVVHVGPRFVDIVSVDENEGAFVATADLRLRWVDLRLPYAPEEAPSGFLQWREAAAEAKLEEIWVPEVALANLLDEPSYQTWGLHLFPDGHVELMQRTTGHFASAFHVERFPFDRQSLQVELVMRRESLERLTLDFHQDDRDFSGASPGMELKGWELGLGDLRRQPVAGWYGARHAQVLVGLEVRRQVGGSLAAIFIPLFASLLILLMVLWMNKLEDGDFAIEAFELANVVIGGLFAVIALNFTVNSEYSTLGSGDNTVSRLFGLNYLVLALSLAVVVLLYRFNVVKRACGKYVQEQLYLLLLWALPLLVVATAAALLLVARA
jgi:neurotransmitter-gated ion-channel